MQTILNAESKAHHKRADKVIESTREILEKPEVKTAIGQYAVELLSILEQLYIPDQREGVYRMPKNKHEYAIPYIPNLYSRIYVETDMFLPQHPTQVQSLRSLMEQEIGPDYSGQRMSKVAAAFASDIKIKYGEVVDFREQWSAVGVTAWLTGGLDIAKRDTYFRYILKSRPLVRQRVWHMPPFEAKLRELTLIHELTHVLQNMKRPFIPHDVNQALERKVSGELEAYCIENRVGCVLLGRAGMSLLYPKYRSIERKRQGVNGHGLDFEPTESLVRYMLDKKLV